MSQHIASRILTKRAERAEQDAEDERRSARLRRLSLFALVLLLIYLLAVNFNESRTVARQNRTIAGLIDQSRSDQAMFNDERTRTAAQAAKERAIASAKIDRLTQAVEQLQDQVRSLGGKPVASPASARSGAPGAGSTPASKGTSATKSSPRSSSGSSTTKAAPSPAGSGGSEGVPAPSPSPKPSPSPSPSPSPPPDHSGIIGVCVAGICL